MLQWINTFLKRISGVVEIQWNSYGKGLMLICSTTHC